MNTEKVGAYIIDGELLLVFHQPGSPEAGLQVPAGTIRDGEDPLDGVLREAWEETGIEGLAVEARLGEQTYDMSAYGRDEVQHRHWFRLSAPSPLPRHWVWHETHDGLRPPTRLEFFWVPVDYAASALEAGQGWALRES